MAPSAISASARARLIFDQRLRGPRRVNRCRNRRSSPARFCPSIQPWQSATSSASA
jgi:hypothetical protein